MGHADVTFLTLELHPPKPDDRRYARSMIANPLCPNCGAALPPRGASAVYECEFCKRTFEVAASAAAGAQSIPLAERTTSHDFDRLCADAERMIVEVERAHATSAEKAAGLGDRAVMLAQLASKKVRERLATTRKAIAERDETTLRECIEKLTLLQKS
jgi:ribosomal protein L37AE/L43A